MIAAGLSSLLLAKKKTATLCFFQSQGSAPFILAVLRAARSVLCSLQSGGVRRRATSRHDAIESDERFFEQECGANESSAREEKKKAERRRRQRRRPARLFPNLSFPYHHFPLFLSLSLSLNSSSFSQVDDRLGGEGTGKILGVSGAEGWAFVVVPTIIWSLYWASQKDIGDGPKSGGEGEDSGLSL